MAVKSKALTGVGVSLLSVLALALMFLPIAILGLSIWIIVYTFRLESDNCKCALGWKHRFIQVALFINCASFLFPPLQILTIPLTIAFIVVGFMYLNEIEDEEKCSCAQNSAITGLRSLIYMNMVTISLFVILTMLGTSFISNIDKTNRYDYFDL